MLTSYLKVAFGNMLNNRLHTLINMLGLALGLAAFLLLMLFVRHEMSFDSFFPNAERIYRLSADFEESGTGPARTVAGNLAPVAPLIAEADIAEVEAVARLGRMHVLVGKDDQAFYEDNFYWADPAIFDIFAFEWRAGNAATALNTPDSVVVSESMARKYFGEEDPLGQVLLVENTWPLRVTGVIADVPDNSHMQPELLVSMEQAWQQLDFDFERNWRANWPNPAFHTYVLLRPGASIDQALAPITALFQSGPGYDIASYFGLKSAPFTPVPLSDIHLQSGLPGELTTPGNLNSTLAFGAIGVALLLIACINFMNLATARATRRCKEVGLRKAVGAGRSSLVRQFLGECMLTTVIALCLALALVELLLPVFGSLINRELTWALADPGVLLLVVGATVVTSLLAGSYPAFYLSSFRPASVLKPALAEGSRSFSFRNVLVVFQFLMAITLIIATLVVWLQMRHVRTMELGFNKDQIVVLWGTHNEGMGANWEALKQDLRSYPGIAHVAEGDMTPGAVENRPVRIEGGPIEGQNILTKRIGFGFLEAHDIELVAGRYFNEALRSDLFMPPPNVPRGAQPTGAYILNETAVRELGWEPEQALDRLLEVDFTNNFSLTVAGPVIGVVEDVHVQSLRQPIQPLAYYVPPLQWGSGHSFGIASVRLNSGDVEGTMEYIEERWKELNPDLPFIYHFLDDDYQSLYQEEQRQGQLFTLFALLAIVIACLGLFGLASFTAERRRKEIGVRKVMGGSVWSIVLLLTSDFSKLVLLSNLIAWPFAYFAMERWLQGFAYRIDLTPLIFIGSGLIALCIAWVTVGGTAARAASAKPVLALRYE